MNVYAKIDDEKVYAYAPENAVKWQPLAKGIYSSSCLTQCMFLSADRILSTGTDGHAIVWPLHYGIQQSTANMSGEMKILHWKRSTNIHQNSSKVIASHVRAAARLVVSGGDDGSLAFWLACTTSSQFLCPPVLLQRAHASAVTACIIMEQNSRLFIVTSGNDQWVKLWEVVVDESVNEASNKEVIFMEYGLDVKRHQKIKTGVADVSCMAAWDADDDGLHTRVLLCGVGMEVVRVECGQE